MENGMDFMRPISRYFLTPIYSLKEKSRLLKNLKELEQSQWLSVDELQNRQLQKLKIVLVHAYETVEYYRIIFEGVGFNPHEMHNAEDIRCIPVLTKTDIIKNLNALTSGDYHRKDLIRSSTGGSTGTQLHFYVNKESIHQRNACSWRHNRWAKWDLGLPVGALWGNPPKARSLKSKVRQNMLMRMSYLDTMNMDESSMVEFVNNISKYDEYILFGHSHSLYLFAEFLRKEKMDTKRPLGIVSTSMMLMDNERLLIEEVFQQKVFNRYGCEEVGLISSECEFHNGMHLNVDHLFIEYITSDGRPAKAGQEGKVVLTDLTNFGMPFIRYAVGDVGVPSSRMCECGRGLPLMEKISGRTADFLVRENGSKVAGVSLVERVLTKNPAIMQMQIIQHEINRFQFSIAINEGFTREHAVRSLKREFNKIFPKAIMEFIFVDRIEQEISGKYRFSICNVHPAA